MPQFPIVCKPASRCSSAAVKFRGKALEDNKLHVLRTDRPSEDEGHTGGSVPRPRFNWKLRVLIPGLVFGGFALLLGLSVYEELLPGIRVQASPVILKPAEGNVKGAVTVQAAGWLEADPYKSYVTALTDGIVREVLVLEGETVAAGQVVARLVDEDSSLAAQRAHDKVIEQEAMVNVEKAELQAALTEWENPIERQRAVDMGEAQLAETKATLQQIASEITMEESNLEHAKSQHDRAVGLHSSGAISAQEFVRLRSQHDAQVSKIAALRNKHAGTKELIARHEADLRAAKEHKSLRAEERRKLERARATVSKAEAALNQARTALAEAKLRLERTEIRSPMDGVVLSRLTEPGSKVVVMSENPGSARVLGLYDPKHLQVRVDVPLVDAGKISVGQEAEVVVEVLPDKPFSGTVTRVMHEANIQKNTLEAKVVLGAPDPVLRPEMLARVKFLARPDSPTEKSSYRLFAPENAVRGSAGAAATWVVRDFDGDKGTAHMQPVKPGTAKNSGWVDVMEGLQPGDLVITSSVAELKQGKKVRVVAE